MWMISWYWKNADLKSFWIIWLTANFWAAFHYQSKKVHAEVSNGRTTLETLPRELQKLSGLGCLIEKRQDGLSGSSDIASGSVGLLNRRMVCGPSSEYLLKLLSSLPLDIPLGLSFSSVYGKSLSILSSVYEHLMCSMFLENISLKVDVIQDDVQF